MNDLLEAVDLEVRIAAAKSVREHVQAEQAQENEVQPEVIEALTDALIDLRTKQIERIWPEK